MMNRHTGASAGSRQWRGLTPGMAALGLACLLLTASPSPAATPVSFQPQPAMTPTTMTPTTMTSVTTAPTTLLAMSTATAPQAFTTALPEAPNCPQQAAAQPAPPAVMPSVRERPCLGALTGKLLGIAARKAGELFSVPVLVF